MLVYSPEGVEFDKEPVDVRECVAQGWSREAPKAAVVEAPKDVVIEQPSFASNVEPEAPRRGRPSKFGSNDVI